jgi:hypothetical protein
LLAAWLPVFILTGVGVWLVRLRSHNREVPSLKRLLKPPRLRKA